MTQAPATGEAGRRALRRRLLGWYARHRRPLPWRERPTAYGTWISEIMLQQTTVRAVVPYWERFLARFPDVRTLAAADREAVLAVWSGLGYYRRARALHDAARRLVAERGGELPRTRDAWRELPGVGAYTAGAIASIAAGEAVPAVDANARRVLVRWLCGSAAEARGWTPRRLEDVAAALVDPHAPGDWNQAVMELGARVCLPASPRCEACPVADLCRARAAGRAAELPPRRARPPATEVVLSALALLRDGQVLLRPATAAPEVRLRGLGRPLREDMAGLWGGLWSVPLSPWYARPGVPEEDAPAAVAAWRAWLRRQLGDGAPACECCGTVGHAVTTHRLRIRVVRAVLPRGRGRLPGPARWWPADAAAPVSTLARKVLSRARRD